MRSVSHVITGENAVVPLASTTRKIVLGRVMRKYFIALILVLSSPAATARCWPRR
jgi:hypothetical protein